MYHVHFICHIYLGVFSILMSFGAAIADTFLGDMSECPNRVFDAQLPREIWAYAFVKFFL